MMITTITQSAAAASATARVGGIKIAGAVGAEMTEAENGKMVCRLRNSNCVGDVGTDFYLITTAKGNNAHHAGLFFCTLSCERWREHGHLARPLFLAHSHLTPALRPSRPRPAPK